MTSNSCLSEFIIYSCISNKRKCLLETHRDSISVCLSEVWSINIVTARFAIEYTRSLQHKKIKPSKVPN